MAIRSRLRRHRLLAFVVVTFGWSWGTDAVVFALDAWGIWWTTIPRTWGPLIGALVVTWASETPLREWIGRVTTWRVRPALYLLALLVPIAITSLPPLLVWLGGGSISPAPYPLHLLAIQLVGIMFLAGGLEEFGWRGFLQPRIQERTSALAAGIGIGVLWASWHLPLFLAGIPNYESDPASVLYYYSWVVGTSVVLGALFNAAGGSVLPAVLMHASVNQPALLDATGGTLDGSPLLDAVGPGAWWLIVVVLIVVYGARSLSSRSAVLPLSSDSSPPDDPATRRLRVQRVDDPGPED